MNPIAENILTNGFDVVESVMPVATCEHYVEAFERLLLERHAQGYNIGNSTSQVVRDYFLDVKDAVEFIDNDFVDGVMRDLIDDDYTLTSTTARNKQIRPEFESSDRTGGVGWHTDSRYIRKQLIQPALTYYCVYLLQDFTLENGATQYVPESFRWPERVDRNADFEFESVIAPAGSVLFFDSGLVHRAGIATELPWWGIFSLFSPWFVKPYSDYASHYSPEEQDKLNPRLHQLLHFDSLPPKVRTNLSTLKRVRKLESQLVGA